MNFSLSPKMILSWLRATAVSLSIAAFLCIVHPVSAAADIAAHHLFVDRDGGLWVWGENAFGQLGLGMEVGATFPVSVTAATKFSAAVSGMRHTLALDSDGSVWAWGDNSAGQLGGGSFKHSNRPQRLELADVVALAAGDWYSAALDGYGQVWTWGSDAFGQLGDGKGGHFAVSNLPAKVDGLPRVTAISSGSNHILALCEDGTVWAWGRNLEGQLALPGGRFRDHPARVEALTGIVRVLASGNASQAVGQDGIVWLWGYAHGMEKNQPVPVRVDKPVLPVPEAEAYTLGGVVREGRQPVRGAAVSIDGNACGQSDATGRYRCVVPSGYGGSVLARKNGLIFQPIRLGKARLATLNLVGRSDSIKISGTVVSPSRKPVRGIELAARNARCARSDGQGKFVCEVPYGWSGRLIGKRKDGYISESDLIRSVTQPISGFVFPVDAAINAPLVVVPVKPVQPIRPVKSAAVPLREFYPNGQGRDVAPDDETHHASSPLPNPLPRAGEGAKVKGSGFDFGAKESLREFRPKAAVPDEPTVGSSTARADSVRIGGVVSIAASGSGASTGSPVANVSITGENAQCSPSGGNGEYSCVVPSGWTGRLAPSKRNYRFSPSVILFRDVLDDRQQQDFRATFAP